MVPQDRRLGMSADTIDLEFSDLDADIAPPDIAPLLCHEPGCTNPVTKPARGRTPKFCDEHKGRRGVTVNNKSRASGKTWARATEIETHLKSSIATIGNLVEHFVDETDGALISEHAPNIIHELVELAKDDKKLQDWLVWLSAPGKYGPLMMATMPLVTGMYLNHAAKAAMKRAERERIREAQEMGFSEGVN